MSPHAEPLQTCREPILLLRLSRSHLTDPDTGRIEEWRQVKKCTKKRTQREAHEAAFELEQAALKEAGAGDAVSRKVMGILKEAGTLAVRGALTEDLARQCLSSIHEAANGHSLRFPTVREWFEEYFARKAERTATSTLNTYRPAKVAFLEFIGPKADGRLEQVVPADVRKFREKIHKAGRTAKTADQYKKFVHGAFEAAVREGVLERNPAAGLESLPATDSKKRGPFTAEQVSSLLKVAPPEWRLSVLFGVHTGLRLQDIVNLRWGQVDLDEHRVTVTPKKQRRSLAAKKIIGVPLHPQLAQAIIDLPGTDDPDAPLMPSLAGRRPGGRGGLSREFLEIMARAGIPPEVKQRLTDGSGSETISLSFHSMRHTFITALTEQGVSKDVRMGLAGQTDEAVHAGYSHLSEQQLREGINRLPSL